MAEKKLEKHFIDHFTDREELLSMEAKDVEVLRTLFKEFSSELHTELDQRFDKVDQRFDQMDQKFESKFEQMDQKFESRFEQMDQKFESKFEQMERKYDKRFNKMDQKMKEMDRKFDKRFQSMDRKSDQRFQSMDQKIDRRSELLLDEIVRTRTGLESRINGLDQKMDDMDSYYRIHRIEDSTQSDMLKLYNRLDSRVDDFSKFKDQTTKVLAENHLVLDK